MNDPVNPAHYKSALVIPASQIGRHIDPETGDLTLQYVECMEYMLTPEEFVGHMKGQAFKYLMRLGKKDTPSQDAAKAAWYPNWLSGVLQRWGK